MDENAIAQMRRDLKDAWRVLREVNLATLHDGGSTDGRTISKLKNESVPVTQRLAKTYDFDKL